MKFKLGFFNWSIKFFSRDIKADDGDRVHGLTYIDERLIKIDMRQSKQCTRETLMHELLHACFDDFMTDDELEESIVRHISPKLMDLLDNNDNVRDYLFPGDDND